MRPPPRPRGAARRGATAAGDDDGTRGSMMALGSAGRGRAWWRLRRPYLILLVTTVLAGLTVHLHGAGLAAPARDVLGDALWAAMILWLVTLAVPGAGLLRRAAAALAICFAVEFGQRIEHPVLRAIRGSTLGHLVIGSDFDARDLVAYTAGVAAAALIARTAVGPGRVRAVDRA